MIRRVAPWVLVGLIVATITPSAADAQATDPIEAMLRNGVEMRRRGDDAGALEVFRQAYAQSRSPIALAQMGFAEQALGRWLEAEAHVRMVLAIDDPWIAQNRADIQQAYTVISQHVGRIEILGGPPGAEVALNGETVGRLPLSEPIRALGGRATLDVRAPGYYPVSREITVVAGETTRETIASRRIATTTTTTVDTSAGSTQRTGALIAAVGGVLLLAGGFTALAVRENNVQSYNQDPTCPGTDSTDQPGPCADHISNADMAETLATVGLAAGGAAAALSIILFVTAPTTTDRGRATARIVCTPGPGTVGVACGFRY